MNSSGGCEHAVGGASLISLRRRAGAIFSGVLTGFAFGSLISRELLWMVSTAELLWNFLRMPGELFANSLVNTVREPTTERGQRARNEKSSNSPRTRPRTLGELCELSVNCVNSV